MYKSKRANRSAAKGESGSMRATSKRNRKARAKIAK